MALTNSGFDGTVTESDYARMWGIGGADGVDSAASWLVSQGTGRQVSIAAQSGYAFAKGVVSRDSAAELVNLTTPAAGGWYLIVRHIDWTTNVVSTIALTGPTTTSTVPTAPPVDYSGVSGMSTAAGTQWDQPLAWAWVRTTDTTMVLFDLRNIGGEPVDLAALATWGGAENIVKTVQEGGARFQRRGGIWVQVTPATFASATARDTAYAKASGAYRVATTALVLRTDKLYEERWNGTVWQPFGATKVINAAAALNPIPTSTTDVTSTSLTFTVDANSAVRAQIDYGGRVQMNTTMTVTLTLSIDGASARQIVLISNTGSQMVEQVADFWLASLAAGSHTIKLQALCNVATSGILTQAFLAVTLLDVDPNL